MPISSTELVVTEPFALDGVRYQRGSVIADAARIAVVEKRFPRHFVRRRARAAVSAPVQKGV